MDNYFLQVVLPDEQELHERYPLFGDMLKVVLEKLDLPISSSLEHAAATVWRVLGARYGGEIRDHTPITVLTEHMERMITGRLWWLVNPAYIHCCLFATAAQLDKAHGSK